MATKFIVVTTSSTEGMAGLAINSLGILKSKEIKKAVKKHFKKVWKGIKFDDQHWSDKQFVAYNNATEVIYEAIPVK